MQIGRQLVASKSRDSRSLGQLFVCKMERRSTFGVVTMTSANSLIITPINPTAIVTPTGAVVLGSYYFKDAVGNIWAVILNYNILKYLFVCDLTYSALFTH